VKILVVDRFLEESQEKQILYPQLLAQRLKMPS
jgi:hypothetical protein